MSLLRLRTSGAHTPTCGLQLCFHLQFRSDSNHSRSQSHSLVPRRCQRCSHWSHLLIRKTKHRHDSEEMQDWYPEFSMALTNGQQGPAPSANWMSPLGPEPTPSQGYESTRDCHLWRFPRQMWLCVCLWLASLIYMPYSDTQAVAYGKKQKQERTDLLFTLENKQANRS